MKAKITKTLVDSLRPGECAYDPDVHGFVARRLRSGTVTYGYRYTVNGKNRWFSLGIHGRITPHQARQSALATQALIHAGGDPFAAGTVSFERQLADKAKTFLERGIEPACYLYRHYNPNGDLMYVGISLEPFRRQDTHIKGAAWRHMIHRILIEPFATREEALAAEQAAIRNEFPRFNAVHNRHRHPVQELRSRSTSEKLDEAAE
jgi:Arm DNA-binding domain